MLPEWEREMLIRKHIEAHRPGVNGEDDASTGREPLSAPPAEFTRG